MLESSGNLIKAMIIAKLEKQDEESFYPKIDSCDPIARSIDPDKRVTISTVSSPTSGRTSMKQSIFPSTDIHKAP